MLRYFLKSKLHQATVTQAELYYEGSLTLDEELIELADLHVHEKISVVNINNGERFETYIIKGERGSRTVCLNGAAARKVAVGDKLIIMSYCLINDDELKNHKPKILVLDDKNNVKRKGK